MLKSRNTTNYNVHHNSTSFYLKCESWWTVSCVCVTGWQFFKFLYETAAAGGKELGHARLVSCSPHPSLSHSLSDAESLSLNSTATRRAKIEATSFNALTRSTSFCSIFSTFLSLIPANYNSQFEFTIFITTNYNNKLLLYIAHRL